MRKLLYVLLSATLPFFVWLWAVKTGGTLSNWLLLVSLLPALWSTYRDDFASSDEDASTSGVVTMLLLGASLFMLVIGALAWSLKGQGSLLEVLSFMLPFGAIGLLLVVVRVWFGSR